MRHADFKARVEKAITTLRETYDTQDAEIDDMLAEFAEKDAKSGAGAAADAEKEQEELAAINWGASNCGQSVISKDCKAVASSDLARMLEQFKT